MTYYERNREECKKKSLEWYSRNREHCMDRMRAYYNTLSRKRKRGGIIMKDIGVQTDPIKCEVCDKEISDNMCHKDCAKVLKQRERERKEAEKELTLRFD